MDSQKSRQRFFDKTLENMRKQGCKSMGAGDESGGSCRYRGANNTKCAIGGWISNTKYTDIMEGRTVRHDIVFLALPKWIQKLGMTFLEDMQIFLHDTVQFDRFQISLEERAKLAANKYNLIYTPPA